MGGEVLSAFFSGSHVNIGATMRPSPKLDFINITRGINTQQNGRLRTRNSLPSKPLINCRD